MRSRCLRLLCRRQLQVWPRSGESRLRPGRDAPFSVRAAASRRLSSMQAAFDGETHDFSHSNLSVDERRLLGRARLHNIFSFERLLFEADVGNTQYIGAKLTDKSNHRQDLELWQLLLDVNRHRQGLDGIKATWRGMKYRGSQVQLPSESRTAMALFEIFVSAGATRDVAFLKQICKDCVDKRMVEDRLLVEVVGTLLRYRPKYAPAFATYLQHHSIQGRDDLLNLFNIACESEAEGALQCFRDVRTFLPDMKVYHDFVSRLCNLERMNDALMMHNFLLSQQDMPRSFDALAPFVRHFAWTGANMDSFLHGLRAAGISFEAQIRRSYARERARVVGFHPETLNITASNLFGREPRNLKDETIARALATPGFSFEFVIKFLQPFGLIQVGPISVRQMALTSGDLSELSSRFDKLRDLEIDTGSSAYVRILKKLCRLGHPGLLDIFTKTDMHHEEFEDLDLQRSLLSHYLKKRDSRQLNRSLAILNVGEVNSRTQSIAANLILRSAVELEDWAAVVQAVEVFRRHGYNIEKSTIRFLVQSLLPTTSAKQSTFPSGFDQVGFLIGILQQLLLSGIGVQPAIWVKPLLALGRLGRLDEVDGLMLWLADYYCRRNSRGAGGSNRIRVVDGDLGKLFTRTLLSATVSWSFTKCNWRHTFQSHEANSVSAPTQPWLRGAILLKTLHDTYGIRLDVPGLQEVFLVRVKSLHKPRVSSRLLENRLIAARYGVKVVDYLKSWSSLWNVVPSGRDQFGLLSNIRRVAGPLRRFGRRPA